ncbi:MAG: arylsulfotransferase family protein [Solirubrobacteraceae bacterium]
MGDEHNANRIDPGADRRRASGAADRFAPVTRREFVAGLGVAGVSVALAGCGGSGNQGQSLTDSATADPFVTEPDLHPPGIHIATAAREPAPGQYVFTDVHAGTGQQGALIIGRDGELAYFDPVSDHGGNGRRVMNVRVQSYRGQPVMTYWQGAMISGHGQGSYQLLDRSYRQVAEVHAGNGYQGDLHEFRLTDRGTALLTAYGTGNGTVPASDGQAAYDGPYFYGIAQEVDIATGRVLLQWRSDHHVPLEASYEPRTSSPDGTWDYFHINSIDVDPDDDNLIISSRSCAAFYKVDRQTGAVIWRCGGRDSDFELDPQARFFYQHDVVPHGSGRFTIFDNEGGPPRRAAQSRGLAINLDLSNHRASFVDAFGHHPGVYSSALGSVQTLEQGHTFVGWGVATYFTEYDQDGRVVFDARLEPVGTNSYRAFQEPWAGRPHWPPKIAARRTGRTTTVYLSWNGSTTHRRWQLLGGDHRDQLAPFAIHRTRGFETAIELANAPRWIAARALDDRGAELATSGPLHIAAAG